MAAPVLDPVADRAIPAGKSLIVPLTASDADNDPLTYTITSGDTNVTETVHTGNPFMKHSVQNFGDLTLELLRGVAPRTSDIIAGLASGGFYSNLTFHRVIPNFVIQGGDPLGNGTGGLGFNFDDEFNPEAIFSGNGQLAMANSGRDTNGSPFFVTIGPQRFLDFSHTTFGQLVRGFDVLDRISRVPTVNDRPTTPVVITKAALVGDNAAVTPDQGYTGPVHLRVGVKQAGATARGSDTSNP